MEGDVSNDAIDMSDLLVRNVPSALKSTLEESAKRAGVSLSDRAIELIRAGLTEERNSAGQTQKSAWEAWRSVFEEAGALDDEFQEIMAEIERERKSDFGRPIPDFE